MKRYESDSDHHGLYEVNDGEYYKWDDVEALLVDMETLQKANAKLKKELDELKTMCNDLYR